MKVKTILFGALVAMMPIALTSCDPKDDDNSGNTGNQVDVAKIVGEYQGYTLTNSNYFEDYFSPDESVAITKAGDKSVDVVLASNVWGTATVSGATVSANGSRFAVSGTGTCVMQGMGGGERSYDCSLSADIASTADATITVSLPAVMGGSTVVFKPGRGSTGYYVADSYRGDIAVSVAGENYLTLTDTVIKLKGETGDKASITIPEVGMQMGPNTVTIPATTFQGISVATTDYTSFVIPEQQVSITVGSTNYSGTLTGSVANGVLALTYNLTPGAMPMPITFTFTQSVSK